MLLPFIHLTQALLSTYTGWYSYISITRVQTYESATQKIAKYSNIADNHLQTTRTTQAAGAVVSSFTISTYLLLANTSPLPSTLLSVLTCIGITAAHSHVSNYWRGKAKVPLPGSGDYNTAIDTSNRMRQLLAGLAVSWGVVGVWYFVRWVE